MKLKALIISLVFVSATNLLASTKDVPVVLYRTDLWGHDDSRHGGDHQMTIEEKGSECIKTQFSPAFMNTQKSSISIEVIGNENCLPFRIAAEIRRQVGKCSPTYTVESSKRSKLYFEEVTLNLNEECLCYRTKYSDKSYGELESFIIAPMNYMFNGLEYRRIFEKTPGSADECTALANNEIEKQAISEAFQTVK